MHCDFVKSGAPSLPVRDLKLQGSLDQNFIEAWSLSKKSHSLKRGFLLFMIFPFLCPSSTWTSFSSKTTLNHVPLGPNPGIQTHLRCPLTLSNCDVISEMQYRSRQAAPLRDRSAVDTVASGGTTVEAVVGGSWLTVEDVIDRARKITLAAEAFWQVQARVMEL